MNGKLSDDTETRASIEAWLDEHLPPWAAKVRGIYGTDADDVLAMVGVEPT